MKKYFTKKYILTAFIAFLIIGQFFPIDKKTPTTDATKDFINVTKHSEELAFHLKSACYDCHSNETKYPWYTSVFPFSRWIGGHIKNGRKTLNFSEWADLEKNKKIQKLEASIDAIETNWMPMKTYVFMHPQAKMEELDKKALIKWFKKLSNEL